MLTPSASTSLHADGIAYHTYIQQGHGKAVQVLASFSLMATTDQALKEKRTTIGLYIAMRFSLLPTGQRDAPRQSGFTTAGALV